MNANVLHRWLKEHARTGCHQPAESQQPNVDEPACATPAFIPLRLPARMPEPVSPELKVELRKGALSMTVTWPIHAAADFARWVAAVLK